MKISSHPLTKHERTSHDPYGSLFVGKSPEGVEKLFCKDFFIHEIQPDSPYMDWDYVRDATADDVERLGVK